MVLHHKTAVVVRIFRSACDIWVDTSAAPRVATAGQERARTSQNTALEKEIRLAYNRLHRVYGVRVTFTKVKGHSGDNWNDVADALASAGRNGTDPRHPRILRQIAYTLSKRKRSDNKNGS